MYYQAVCKSTDLEELRHNTKAVIPGHWISKLPSAMESIGYEIRGGFLIVKFEESEDGRIPYGNVAYKFKHVSSMIALACALHKKKMFKVGTSVYEIHVTVNHPEGMYAVTTDLLNNLTHHQVEGMVFVKEGDFYLAITDERLAEILVDRIGLSLGNIIDHRYLVRFKTMGKFKYYPLAWVFTDPELLTSYLKPDEENLPWNEKLTEIEQFVEGYTT
jgi:hypothetical protein